MRKCPICGDRIPGLGDCKKSSCRSGLRHRECLDCGAVMREADRRCPSCNRTVAPSLFDMKPLLMVAALIPMLLVGVLIPEGSTQETLTPIAALGGLALVPLGFMWKQRQDRKRRGY